MGKEKQKEQPKGGIKGFFHRLMPRWIPAWISIPLITVIAGLVVILFVQDNDIFKIYSNDRQINELKKEIKQNMDSVDYYQKKTQELFTDREELERISREQYHMKRVHEDVYITDIP